MREQMEFRQKITCLSEQLGDSKFREDYCVKYAYASGSMYRGIASEELVVAMAKARLMSFFGAGGLSLENIESAIVNIQARLTDNQSFGMNLLAHHVEPEKEMRVVGLYIKYKIRYVEASAFIAITPALVRYRLSGVWQDDQGVWHVPNMVMAKVSRPEVAQAFMQPAPAKIVTKLLAKGFITELEAAGSENISMAADICVEADSGGHTDRGNVCVLLPEMLRMRDRFMRQEKYPKRIRIGAAGGIGTPEAAMAAWVLGAEFILTGSINQCTVEAGTSDQVKDLLQRVNVQDTEYAPAGDMFETGARVQVLKKGVFFPARANKLFQLYQHYNSLDELPENAKKQLQKNYFKCSFDQIWQEVAQHYQWRNPDRLHELEKHPKKRMAAVFRWYFSYSTQLAITGATNAKLDYQVHCGSALGAFNQWVKGTRYESWRERRVNEIAEHLVIETSKLLSERIQRYGSVIAD